MRGTSASYLLRKWRNSSCRAGGAQAGEHLQNTSLVMEVLAFWELSSWSYTAECWLLLDVWVVLPPSLSPFLSQYSTGSSGNTRLLLMLEKPGKTWRGGATPSRSGLWTPSRAPWNVVWKQSRAGCTTSSVKGAGSCPYQQTHSNWAISFSPPPPTTSCRWLL